jgi:dihydrofolate synthase / folylpolyglutamate synthase
MIVRPVKTRVFKEGEDLFAFICKYFKKLPEKSVLIVTSKIVALSENRTAPAGATRAKIKHIKAESKFALRTKYVWLTVKDGMIVPTAGIDESNANGKLIFLPRDSFKTAQNLRKRLRQRHGLKKLGVVITDSRTMPLRSGVTGVALGYAGFAGLRDYRQKPDIFGRPFKFSTTNVADCLATAAVVEMGEGNEQRPLAIITNAPVEFKEKVNRRELVINPRDDMYRPLLKRLNI